MKKKNKNKINNFKKNNLLIKIKENNIFNLNRTFFPISVFFLFFESIIPFIILFLFSSPELKLKITKNYNLFYGFIFGFLTIISVFFLTLLGYIFKFHKSDQFTYTTCSSWLLYSIYLTGFLLNNYIFFRFLISISVFIFSILFGTFISIFINNINIFLKNKKK